MRRPAPFAKGKPCTTCGRSTWERSRFEGDKLVRECPSCHKKRERAEAPARAAALAAQIEAERKRDAELVAEHDAEAANGGHTFGAYLGCSKCRGGAS